MIHRLVGMNLESEVRVTVVLPSRREDFCGANLSWHANGDDSRVAQP